MNDLTHLDEHGHAHMVDVSAKAETSRSATAGAFIALSPETLALIASGETPKGDVLAAARIAGIMAAKKTPELIPLCHTLMLTRVAVEITAEANGLTIQATVKTKGQTGVEMEALTAASVAALTIYDMVKAVERAAVISNIRLIAKSGGASGDFQRTETAASITPARETPRLVSRGYRRAPGAPSATPKPRGTDAGPATPRATHERAEAFRTFMRANRLQVSTWAANAGLQVGVVYGFLHGRSGRLPKEAEEKLAAAANASVADVFGTE